MNNNYEDLIKNKINNYMEQIEVPKNLGGIIMEDYGKIKNEEVKKSNQTNDQEPNNKPKKNKNKVLMGSVAAVSAAVLVGAGVLVGSRFFGNQNITINGNSGQNSGMVSPNEENVVEENKVTGELVTDAYKYEWINPNDSTIKKSYRIPKINIDSEYAREINDYINKNLTQRVQQNIQKMIEANNGEIYGGIEYKYYLNNDILSVIIEEHPDFPVSVFYVYNINTKTGKETTNEDLLKIKNMSSSQFTEKMKNATRNKYIEKYGEINTYIKGQSFEPGYSESDAKKMYQEQYDKTISESNCSTKNPMFLDSNGQLNVVATIYSLAGASEYSHILNIENQKTNIYTVDGKDGETAKNNSTKVNLSKEEITKLQNFINNPENNPFVQLYYNNPEDIFNNEKNKVDGSHSSGRILSYAFNLSKYTRFANKEEEKVIWKGQEAQVPTKVTSEEDLIKFFKEKLDCTYSKDTLRSVFDFYSNLNNSYVTTISDALGKNYSIKEGYKENGKIYLSLLDNENNGSEVVLTEKDGSYYFYSCNPNTLKELTTSDIEKLESFMNKPHNNMFTVITYKKGGDFLETLKANNRDRSLLKYSISESVYAKKATMEQVKKLYNFKNDSEIIGSTYLISESDFIKYLEEQLATLCNDVKLKETFKDYWNNELNMYVFTFSDTAFTKAKIISGYKGEFGQYYLNLNHGQKLILMERNDGSIIFESCEGFDGKIGQ